MVIADDLRPPPYTNSVWEVTDRFIPICFDIVYRANLVCASVRIMQCSLSQPQLSFILEGDPDDRSGASGCAVGSAEAVAQTPCCKLESH